MTDYVPAPAGDFVLPFDLPAAGARGRLVRLEQAATRAILPHDLPEAAARAEGELLALVGMLGSLLKLDGRLTVQTKAQGPLGMVVADYYGADETAGRGVRGLAQVDLARLASLGRHPSFSALCPDGALAITVRPRVDARDYQGIVPLSPKGLAASAEAYFSQSEQLATLVRLSAAPLLRPGAGPVWRAGGLILQLVPDATRSADDWDRVSMLAATVADVELVDTGLPAETLLWRLFHQEEVRLLPAEPISFRCDCDRRNIETAIRSYSREERAALAETDGVIRAKCEFCGTVYEFPAELP